MDISALVHSSDIDVPRLDGLPDSPSSVSSSTVTHALATPATPATPGTSREGSSSALDDDNVTPPPPPPPMYLHVEKGYTHNYTQRFDNGRLTFPSLQDLPMQGIKQTSDQDHDDQDRRPLPPMLAPLTLPPLPSPIGRCSPSPSIRRTRGTRPRPFVCWCGNAFSKREHLKRHDMLVHKALRPYRCEVCQVDFGTKQNMQVHFTTRKHRDREMFIRGRG